MTKKLNISKGSVRQTVKEWTIITLGVLLYSFAWVSIILPADGMGGGATGIAMLVYYATGGIDGGVPIGISYFVVNAILITAAVFIIGAKFGIKTIYSIILMSIAMSVMQAVIPNNILGLANDKLLSALLGGGVAGLGISLVLMQGGSTGGSDIIAMIINKYRNISYGRVVLVTDCIIIGASYFIEHNLAQVIYGYVLTATFSVTADVMLAGNKQSAQQMKAPATQVEVGADIRHVGTLQGNRRPHHERLPSRRHAAGRYRLVHEKAYQGHHGDGKEKRIHLHALQNQGARLEGIHHDGQRHGRIRRRFRHVQEMMRRRLHSGRPAATDLPDTVPSVPANHI